MKLIFIFLFISLQCGAQSDTVLPLTDIPLTDTVYFNLGTPEYNSFECMDNDTNFIRMDIINCDTSITISGDTINGIKSMFKDWGKEMQENIRLKELLNEAAELLYQKFYGIEAILPEKKRI